MKKTTIAWGALAFALALQPAMASDETRHRHGQHMHGALHGDKTSPSMMKEHGKMAGAMGAMQGSWMKQEVIDGYQVLFHVMRAMGGTANGAAAPSHSLMIKVEQGGKVLTDLVVNSKVIYPNGKSESKMMMKMGDWYMAGYNLRHAGGHQVMVLFKTRDGRKHFGGVLYHGGQTTDKGEQ